MLREELVFVGTCDIAGHVRGKGFPARETRCAPQQGYRLDAFSNLMQSAFGPILDTPFGTAGDLMIVPDPSAEVRVDFADGSAAEHFFLGDIRNTDGTPGNAARAISCAAPSPNWTRHRGCACSPPLSRNSSTPATSTAMAMPTASNAFRRQGSFGETFIAALRAAGVVPEHLPRGIRRAPVRGDRDAAPALDRRRPRGDHPRDGACRRASARPSRFFSPMPDFRRRATACTSI